MAEALHPLLFDGAREAGIAAAAVFVAYVVFGISGFGSALIAVPVLAHLMPLKAVVPIIALCEVVAALTVGRSRHAALDRATWAWLVPPMLAGIAIGVTLLVTVPARWLLLALGAFVTVYALRLLTRRGAAPRPLGPIWALPAGLTGGVMSALFGTGGPFYLLFVAARVHEKSALRATISAVLGTSNAVRLAIFAAGGLLLQPGLLGTAAVLLPIVLAGLWLGGRLHQRVSREQMLGGIGVLLVASGVSLIVRALWPGVR